MSRPRNFKVTRETGDMISITQYDVLGTQTIQVPISQIETLQLDLTAVQATEPGKQAKGPRLVKSQMGRVVGAVRG